MYMKIHRGVVWAYFLLGITIVGCILIIWRANHYLLVKTDNEIQLFVLSGALGEWMADVEKASGCEKYYQLDASMNAPDHIAGKTSNIKNVIFAIPQLPSEKQNPTVKEFIEHFIESHNDRVSCPTSRSR